MNVASNYCQTCAKHFSTVNAYDSHIRSKKHRDTMLKPIKKKKNRQKKKVDEGAGASNDAEKVEEKIAGTGDSKDEGKMEEKVEATGGKEEEMEAKENDGGGL